MVAALGLTQGPLPVHSLDVHQARQVGSHRDGVGPGVLVGPLDAAALPVGPVDVGPQQGQAVRVLDGSHQGAAVLPVQVGRLDALEEEMKGGSAPRLLENKPFDL